MENECANPIPEEKVEPQQPVEQAMPVLEPISTGKKKLSKKVRLIAILAGIALIVALAVVAIVSHFSAESVAERYIKASTLGNFKTVEKYCAYDLRAYILGDDDEDDYFELMGDLFEEDIEDWDDFYKYLQEEMKEELDDEYGDYKLTVEATKTKKMSTKKLSSELGDFLEELEDNDVDFDSDNITSCKLVTVKLKIKGEDETERLTYSVYMIRVGLSWKVLYTTQS